MKKIWWFIIGLVFIGTAIGGFFLTNQLTVVNAWSKETPVVMNNKIWRINFSSEIQTSSVNANNIFVLNDEGKKIQTELILTNEGKTVIIYPPKQGYDAKSKHYTLHVTKDLKGKNGRKLRGEEQLAFIVKENLPSIGSKSKLNDYFLKVIDQQQKAHKFSFFNKDTAMEKSTSEDSNKSASDGSSVSETNVQVQGIDEADIVKTDGTYIYIVIDGKVRIIKAFPAETMTLMSEITYKQHHFTPTQLFHYKDKLVVIGQSYRNETQSYTEKSTLTDKRIAPMFHASKVIVYDIKDVKNPKQIREIEVEGSLTASRMMNGIVYVIAHHYPDYWILEKDASVDLRPRISDTAANKEFEPVDYKKIQYFHDSKETNFTIIASFNLKELTNEAAVTTYLGSGQQIYMSTENLYLAVTNYSLEPIRSDEFFSPDTSIYKFTIDGTKVEFNSSTEVPGTVLNQFSMDEAKGYFRIAVTKGSTFDENRPSENNLYIFDQELKEVGKLEGLARGERIYSARFMGDRIYLVTFKETDPLFVIDASEPTSPKVLGELKIPGFSNYLHPYDDNHIIGFGHDTKIISEKGSTRPIIRTNGVKLSIFDVSDVKNPKEKFTEIIGGSSTHSPLNYDHKALLYNKAKSLFAFPISVYQNVEGKEFEQTFEFQGAYVYNIDLIKGFNLRTKITHIEGTPQYEEWPTMIQRLVYIGNNLYTLSPSKITAHNMESFEKVGEFSYE